MGTQQSPTGKRHLIAVMRSEQDARDAVRRLESEGVGPGNVRIDDDRDVAPALRAEMRAEVSDAFTTSRPFMMVAPKEGYRGFVLFASVAAVVVVLLAALLALIDFGWHYWLRFLIAAAVCTPFALMISLVFGRGLGATNKDDAAAADRGTILRIAEDSPRIRQTLSEMNPIRIDEVTPTDEPAGTVYTEADPGENSLTDKVKDTVQHVRDEADKPLDSI
jgi:hypothetical protein